MSLEPVDLCDGERRRSNAAAPRPALRALRQPVADKRVPKRGPLAPAAVTSAHPRGGHVGAPRVALNQQTGVGGYRGGAQAPIADIQEHKKGVVDQ
jgi:hypothetical protein